MSCQFENGYCHFRAACCLKVLILDCLDPEGGGSMPLQSVRKYLQTNSESELCRSACYKCLVRGDCQCLQTVEVKVFSKHSRSICEMSFVIN